MNRPVTKKLASLVVAVALGGAAFGMLGGSAAAAPSNAPSAFVGTAQCGSAAFSLVINPGNGNGQSTQWFPAFLSSDGSSALFIPTELHLTFTSPFGPFSVDATKGNAPGSVGPCDISGQAVNGPVSFVGTAFGNIVTLGH